MLSLNRSWQSWQIAGILVFALACVLLFSATKAVARGERAGDFDYYVLAMSWSPTYCLEQGDRRRDAQCRPGAGHGFVAHGLWPQFRRGWPSECRVPASRRFVPDSVIREVLDVMPAKGLVIHQWRKHGVCSGLSPRAFFDLTERLFRMVRIPPDYQRPVRPLKRTVEQLRRDFAAANREAGFTADSFAIVCRRKGRGEALLREIRVCFTPTGRPSRCGANERRAQCRARVVVLPPVR